MLLFIQRITISKYEVHCITEFARTVRDLSITGITTKNRSYNSLCKMNLLSKLDCSILDIPAKTNHQNQEKYMYKE